MTSAEARGRIRVFGRATAELKRGRSTAGDDVQSTRAEADDCQEETDTATDSRGDGSRDKTSEPLSETENGKSKEDESLEEDSSDSLLVADRSSTLDIRLSPSKGDEQTHVETDLTVCEISVDTETRSETER